MGNSFDDIDEIYEHIHNEGHDWTADNPDASQHIGNPIYDKLNSIHEEYGGYNSFISLGEVGLKSWDEIGIKDELIDGDGDVHVNDINEELNKFGGPATINYEDHEHYNIDEHPKFEERYESSAKEWREDKISNDPWEIVDDLYLYEDHRLSLIHI